MVVHRSVVKVLVSLIQQTLRRLLYGGSGRLRGHESRCLEFLAAKLDDDAAGILRTQIGAIDLVQRFSSDRIVVCHFTEEEPNELRLFPNRAPELVVGRLVLSAGGGGRDIACDVVCHRGKLSSLEFSANPRPLRHAEFTAERVDLFADLSVEPEAVTEPRPTREGGEVLRRIGDRHRVTDVLPPAGDDEIGLFAAKLGGLVPADYRALLGETNGFRVGGVRCAGTLARKVATPRTSFWLLAESDELALGVDAGGPDATVFLLDQIDETRTPMSGGFVDSLNEMLRIQSLRERRPEPGRPV